MALSGGARLVERGTQPGDRLASLWGAMLMDSLPDSQCAQSGSVGLRRMEDLGCAAGVASKLPAGKMELFVRGESNLFVGENGSR